MDWTRDRYVACIEATGLREPHKSSCFSDGAIQPDEVCALPQWCLRLIVFIEGRAEAAAHGRGIEAPVDQRKTG